MSKNNTELLKSTILTVIQYTTLAYILAFTTLISDNVALMIIQIIGFIIAAWAIYEMRKTKINIAPTPRKNAILVTSGPYKLIRHPMYLSLILSLTPIIISYYNQTTIIVFSVFLINLILKMLFEESLLKKHYNSYKNYMKHSWRLFPYIY